MGETCIKARNIKTSNNGKFLLVSAFNENLAAYEVSTGKKLGEYSTKYSGERRMCISDSGKLFADAAYNRYGVSLHDVESGKILWTNKQIKKIGPICFSSDDKNLMVVSTDWEMYTLSLEDGSIIESEPGVDDFYPGTDIDIRRTGSGKLKWNGLRIDPKKKILRLCSGKDKVFCSVFGRGLLCYSKEGDLLWTPENEPEGQYIHLAYCSSYEYVLCFGYKTDEERTKPYHFLDVYSAESGALVYTSGIGSVAHAYSDPERIIIDVTGKVFEVGKDSCVRSDRLFDIYSAFHKEQKNTMPRFEKFASNGKTKSTITEVCGVTLPDDYLDFMKKYNGGEGFIGGKYLELEPLENLEIYNNNLMLADDLENIFIFGSDLCYKHFGYDGKKKQYFFIDDDESLSVEEAVKYAGKAFEEFLSAFAALE